MSPELEAYLRDVQHKATAATSMMTALDDLIGDCEEHRDILMCLSSALKEQLGKVSNALDCVNLPKGGAA